jgi:hypothetical protein
VGKEISSEGILQLVHVAYTRARTLSRPIERERDEGIASHFPKRRVMLCRGEDNDRATRSNGGGEGDRRSMHALSIESDENDGILFFLRTAARRIRDLPIPVERSSFSLRERLPAWRSPFPRTSPIDIYLNRANLHPIFASVAHLRRSPTTSDKRVSELVSTLAAYINHLWSSIF